MYKRSGFYTDSIQYLYFCGGVLIIHDIYTKIEMYDMRGVYAAIADEDKKKLVSIATL